MDHTMKLKFSSYVHLSGYVHLPPVNKMFQYRYARVILCNVGEVIIFEHGRYISDLEVEHIRMLNCQSLSFDYRC